MYGLRASSSITKVSGERMLLMPEKLCLIVDDDATVRSYIRTLLHHVEGFDTVEADGGNPAFDLVQELGDALDLIITDIQMPDGDGVTFARAVRQTFNGIPVIFVSALEPSS